MIYKRSSALFAEAEKVIPGGVNSPVRAFKGVGGTPIFVKEAKGAYLYDEDGNQKLKRRLRNWQCLWCQTLIKFVLLILERKRV